MSIKSLEKKQETLAKKLVKAKEKAAKVAEKKAAKIKVKKVKVDPATKEIKIEAEVADKAVTVEKAEEIKISIE